MQKKNYDSEFCGSVPLNFVNQVQPYGVLVILDRNNLNIIQVSQNIEPVLGLVPENIIDTPFSNYVQAGQVESLVSRFSKNSAEKLPLNFTFNTPAGEKNYLAITHLKDEFYLLELEEVLQQDGRDSSFLGVYQEIKYATVAINEADTIEEVCQTTLRELKRISGFDKIMIYQFDEDWNGIVIGEIMEEGMEPYLGLRFPASDIPRQARAMYQKNPYRQIPDCHYTPVKLYPVINPVTHAFTDLSDCNLRGVATVHTEYLKNMNITASMSTRIVKDEKLWGLISCHHRTKKFLSYELCSVFELLSGILSARLSSLQNTEDFRYATKLQDIQTQLVERIYSENNIFSTLTHGDVTLLDVLNVEGAVITSQKRVETIGNVPDQNAIKDLIIWLQTNGIDKVFHTTELSDIYEQGLSFTHISSGMIVLPIHADKGEYIIGFRPEAIQKVNWSGNPDEAINFESDKKNYHPRNSFRLWQQTVKHNSMPWHRQELAIAESFRNILLEFALKKVYA